MSVKATRACALLLAALVAGPGFAREPDKTYGAPLIDKGMRLEEADSRGSRFVSTRSYGDTVKFYKKLWRGYDLIEFRTIANLPSVRAVHVANNNPKADWEGMNIYEHKGETKVFIIPRAKPAEKPATK